MSYVPPTLKFGGAGAVIPCLPPALQVRAVGAVSSPNNYGNFASAYNTAIGVVNGWNMNSIPWGQAVFLYFTSNGAYTSNGPTSAQLNTLYSSQNLNVSNQAGGGAAYGIC